MWPLLGDTSMPADDIPAAMHRAGNELIIPSDLKFRQVTSEAFEEMLRVRAGQTYDNYGLIAADLAGGKKASKAELDRQ